MLKWADRRCGNCAFWGSPDDPDGDYPCQRLSAPQPYQTANDRCGDHRTEDEVDADIRDRALKWFETEKAEAIANNCLATWAHGRGAV